MPQYQDMLKIFLHYECISFLPGCFKIKIANNPLPILYLYSEKNPFVIIHVLLSMFLPICVSVYVEVVLTDRTLARPRTYVYIIFIL